MSEIRAVILDYGGVVAEEGFREGLKSIARRCGLEEDGFFHRAAELAYSSGFVTGEVDEAGFWRLLRSELGVSLADTELRSEVLTRFVVRPGVISLVEDLRTAGVATAMLTDQTEWLYELDQRDGFLIFFDHVFNSYELGKTKRDPAIFTDVTTTLGIAPAEALFVDDNPGHVERAAAIGLKTVLFDDPPQSIAEVRAEALGTEEAPG